MQTFHNIVDGKPAPAADGRTVGSTSYDGPMSPADLALGAHVEQTDPVAEAVPRAARAVREIVAALQTSVSSTAAQQGR